MPVYAQPKISLGFMFSWASLEMLKIKICAPKKFFP